MVRSRSKVPQIAGVFSSYAKSLGELRKIAGRRCKTVRSSPHCDAREASYHSIPKANLGIFRTKLLAEIVTFDESLSDRYGKFPEHTDWPERTK